MTVTSIQFLEAVRSLIGTRMVYRGRSPVGVDCSGLVHVGLNLCGIQVEGPPPYGTLPSTKDLEDGLSKIAVRTTSLVPGVVVQVFRGAEARHMGVYDTIEHGGRLWIHAEPKVQHVVRDILPLKKIYAIWRLKDLSW